MKKEKGREKENERGKKKEEKQRTQTIHPKMYQNTRT